MPAPLLAARRAAAGLRFNGADEGAHEFAVDLRRDFVDVDALTGEKLAGVFDAIDARGFEIDLIESDGPELGAIFVLLERTGDATDPGEHALANFGRHVTLGDHIGDGEAAAGFEHAESFGEDA